MPKNTSKSLQKMISDQIKSLADATDEALISEKLQAFFSFCARFHNYSVSNLWLIAFQCPHATRVAGYRKWNQFNRYVRKGEQGIAILAPMIYKKDGSDEKKLHGFKPVYVFDVSQTDGEPLPEPPDWSSKERLVVLEDRLVQFASSKEITIEREEIAGSAEGVSKGGKIVVAPDAGTKVLIHEIAHELLHKATEGKRTTRQSKEIEAETVAYVVGSHFGIIDDSAANYLALWSADSDKIMERQERVRKCATEIITAIEDPD